MLKRPTPVKSRAKKKDPKDAANKDPNAPKHRMNYQIIECDFCPMKYHKWSAFYVHRCSHTGETPVLPCGICEMEFPNIKGKSKSFLLKGLLKNIEYVMVKRMNMCKKSVSRILDNFSLIESKWFYYL